MDHLLIYNRHPLRKLLLLNKSFSLFWNRITILIERSLGLMAWIIWILLLNIHWIILVFLVFLFIGLFNAMIKFGLILLEVLDVTKQVLLRFFCCVENGLLVCDQAVGYVIGLLVINFRVVSFLLVNIKGYLKKFILWLMGRRT